VIDVHIPKMGMSTVEVDVVAVHVAPGDRVEADTIVVEVQSEKANFEVEAGTAGVNDRAGNVERGVTVDDFVARLAAEVVAHTV